MAVAATAEGLFLPLRPASDKPVVLGTFGHVRATPTETTFGKPMDRFRMSPTSNFRKLSFDHTPTPHANEYMHPALLWPPTPSPMAAAHFAHGWPSMNPSAFFQPWPITEQGSGARPADAVHHGDAALDSMQEVVHARSCTGGPASGVCRPWALGSSASPGAQTFGDSGTAFNTTSCTGEVQSQAGAFMESLLPSLGSSLHDGSGGCHPCAWFWKPKGCSIGTACDYCHLCPDGELKRRKKAKIMALRMAEAQGTK